MSYRILVRKVWTTFLNVCSTTTIGTGTSGVALATALTQTVEAVQVYNGSTSTIALCTGTTAAPVVQVLCGPGQGQIIPTEGLFPKGSNMIAVSQDSAASTGTFAVNCMV